MFQIKGVLSMIHGATFKAFSNLNFPNWIISRIICLLLVFFITMKKHYLHKQRQLKTKRRKPAVNEDTLTPKKNYGLKNIILQELKIGVNQN